MNNPNNFDHLFDSPHTAELPDNSHTKLDLKARMPATGQHALYGTLVARTDLAILFYITHKRKEYWFPLSQVGFIRDVPNAYGDTHGKDEIHVSTWFLIKKGLI